MNSLSYSLGNNNSKQYEKYGSYLEIAEDFFLFFYTCEAILKILALGLFFSKNAYFKDGWNILDFIVLVAFYLSYSNTQTINLSLFRLLRLLRPLKTASQFMELRIILYALFSSLPLLFISFAILNFFYIVYSIAGLQVFSGILKQRCLELITGFPIETDIDEGICGYIQCPKNYFCAKLIANPYNDVINYDDLHSAYILTLLTVTLDNWTTIMYSILQAYSNYAWIYFVSLVIVGYYFMMNLLLAVIKVKFSESHQMILLEGVRENRESLYLNLIDLKKEGLWESRKYMKVIQENNSQCYFFFFIYLNFLLF